MTAENVLPMPSRRPKRPRQPAVPRNLRSAEAKRLWRATVAEFRLEAHHLALLEQACKATDRLVEARGVLDRDGIVTRDRFGQLREHPATKVERDSRIALARLLRELQLGDDVVVPDARPPRMR